MVQSVVWSSPVGCQLQWNSIWAVAQVVEACLPENAIVSHGLFDSLQRLNIVNWELPTALPLRLRSCQCFCCVLLFEKMKENDAP